MGDYASSASSAADTASNASSAADGASAIADGSSSIGGYTDYANTTAPDMTGAAGVSSDTAAGPYTTAPSDYGQSEASWLDTVKSGLNEYNKGKEGGFGDFLGRFGEKDNYGMNMQNAGYLGGKVTDMAGKGGSPPVSSTMNVTNVNNAPNTNDRYAQLYRLYSGRA